MNVIFGNHQVYNTDIPLDNLRLKAMLFIRFARFIQVT